MEDILTPLQTPLTGDPKQDLNQIKAHLEQFDDIHIALDRYKLLRVIQAMVDAVLVFDNMGLVQLCNPAFERIFTVSQEEILHQPLITVFGNIAPDLPSIISQFVELGEGFSHEVTLYQEHQQRIFMIYVIPIEENGNISDGVAVFHDVTKVRQTEKMRRDFVANVSHELRTPLSAIHGYAETLLAGAIEDTTVAKEFIQIIFNHSERLSQLVRDLLDLSRLESTESPFDLAPTNIIPTIQKVIELSQKQLHEKRISLSFNPPLMFPEVLAHETNIEQVLTNLLDNAIKYSPDGGAIKVRTFQRNHFVQVDIEDNGMGIEGKHIPRLFERFYRVDKARSRDLGGTGLGLSIVKHIIQSHGGEVWVNSIPGEGSTFSFTLQIVNEAESL